MLRTLLSTTAVMEGEQYESLVPQNENNKESIMLPNNIYVYKGCNCDKCSRVSDDMHEAVSEKSGLYNEESHSTPMKLTLKEDCNSCQCCSRSPLPAKRRKALMSS